MKYILIYLVTLVLWLALPIFAVLFFLGVPGIVFNGHGRGIADRAIRYTL